MPRHGDDNQYDRRGYLTGIGRWIAIAVTALWPDQDVCANIPLNEARLPETYLQPSLGGEVSTPSEIRQQITHNANARADLIKVMASGGALTPRGPRMWEAQFTAEQLRLIVRHAAEHGLSVAALAVAALFAAGLRRDEEQHPLTSTDAAESRR